MNAKSQSYFHLFVVFLIASAWPCSGCSRRPDSDKVNRSSSVPEKQSTAALQSTTTAATRWWCREHGVPEHLCGRCDSLLAADFQRKGDWCSKHDRPDSQCFLCHAELQQRFAAQFEAQFGYKPPPPSE